MGSARTGRGRRSEPWLDTGVPSAGTAGSGGTEQVRAGQWEVLAPRPGGGEGQGAGPGRGLAARGGRASPGSVAAAAAARTWSPRAPAPRRAGPRGCCGSRSCWRRTQVGSGPSGAGRGRLRGGGRAAGEGASTLLRRPRRGPRRGRTGRPGDTAAWVRQDPIHWPFPHSGRRNLGPPPSCLLRPKSAGPQVASPRSQKTQTPGVSPPNFSSFEGAWLS